MRGNERKTKPQKKKLKLDNPLKIRIKAHDDLLKQIYQAYDETDDLVKIFYCYEKEKEGIKEGYGDINMRRAERQIEEIEFAFKLN